MIQPTTFSARHWLLAVAVAALWLPCWNLRAQDAARPDVAENVSAAADGIVFIHVRFAADGTLELLDANARPGVLKVGAGGSEGQTLRCEVTSAAGAMLWNADVQDASVRRLEWEDPAHPGHFLSKTEEVTGADFVVRVPLYAKQQRVAFRRPARIEKQVLTANRTTAQDQGKLLGNFQLNLP